jgi:peptidoglycan-associated lipoprotein
MNRFALVFFAGTLVAASVFGQSPTSQTSTALPSSAEQQEVKQNLQDVHFAFDRYDLDDQNCQILQENANWLKAHPDVKVSIAGNADERGDITYNLALTQKRAEVTRDWLVSHGVSADRIRFATGWGKLYPVCNQADESCWGRNRRAHLTPGSMLQTETVAQEVERLP